MILAVINVYCSVFTQHNGIKFGRAGVRGTTGGGARRQQMIGSRHHVWFLFHTFTEQRRSTIRTLIYESLVLTKINGPFVKMEIAMSDSQSD